MLPRFLAGVCLVALVGCGGSSSETPPPLEPDFGHGAGTTTEPAAHRPKQAATEPASEPPSGTNAPATWGEGDAPADEPAAE